MAADLDPVSLRAFVAAVRAGSISRAASALGHTQPGLSQKLRKLERAVGQPLLHRTSTGVTPTAAGEALMPYAERILSLTAQALADSRKALTGHCGVGILEDLASASLPQALADFARLYPDTTIEVAILQGPQMAAAFAEGRIQLALCDPIYFSEAPRWTVSLPLAWTGTADFDPAISPVRLVLFSQPCNWREPVLQTLKQAGRDWTVTFESTGLVGVQAAVRAGLGIAALLSPTLEAGPYIHAASLPPLPEVELGLMRRASSDGDPLVDALEHLLRRLV